jgi:hypothetical protein
MEFKKQPKISTDKNAIGKQILEKKLVLRKSGLQIIQLTHSLN